MQISWDQINYPEENAIIGFNVYLRDNEDLLIGTTNEESFLATNYYEGEFCVNAYDQFGNNSQTNCAIATSMISYCILLEHTNNLISFPGLPDNVSLENVFSDLAYAAIGLISESSAAFHLGDNIWVGALQTINEHSGYWLILDDTIIDEQGSVNFCLSGFPSENLIYQLFEGPNLLSYPFNASESISETIPQEFQDNITGIIGEGSAAVNINGNWYGVLQLLEGTRGYWVISNQNIEDFYYLAPSQIGLTTNNRSYKENLNNFHYSISTIQSFYFVTEIIGKLPLNGNNYIVSYCNDTVTGYRKWSNDIVDVPVMGDDNNHLTQSYCIEGDTPSFKIYNDYLNKLFDLHSDNIDKWEANSIKFVSFELMDENTIANENKILSIYPNPFNPSTTISISINKDSHVKADIIDIHGNLIEELANDYYKRGQLSIKWKPDNLSSGMYLVKLSSDEINLSKKIIYLK